MEESLRAVRRERIVKKVLDSILFENVNHQFKKRREYNHENPMDKQ